MQREFNDPATRYRQSSLLPLTAAAVLFLAALPAQAQSVTFDGESFVNKGLVAVARLPADAKDKQGDTLGGIGSGMAADLSTMASPSNRRCRSFHSTRDTWRISAC